MQRDLVTISPWKISITFIIIIPACSPAIIDVHKSSCFCVAESPLLTHRHHFSYYLQPFLDDNPRFSELNTREAKTIWPFDFPQATTFDTDSRVNF